MITKPTILLNEFQCRQNIQSMAQKALDHGLEFRPHFKTHQSIEIGQWFKDLGVNKITVSSLTMAEYFSGQWNDITVAFPANILEIYTINTLAKKIKLNILIESVEVAKFLSKNLRHKLSCFIKIDVNTHRTGIQASNYTLIDQILFICKSSSNIEFSGFLGHAGHSYNCRSVEEILAVHRESQQIMHVLKQNYMKAYPELIISLGDTPTCSVATDFEGIDEIRPGNFVFYDLMQTQIGACSINQISVALACPVVAIHKNRNEIVIYGGGVHLSKDRLQTKKEGIIYGRVAKPKEYGWDMITGMYVKSLSQEHGIIFVPTKLMESFKVGDLVHILPVHSCMMVDLMRSYLTTKGNRISC
jgi:D-serine deaminase-like pyridoxal phosphate-dependent protein